MTATPRTAADVRQPGRVLYERYRALHAKLLGDLTEWTFLRYDVRAVWNSLAIEAEARAGLDVGPIPQPDPDASVFDQAQAVIAHSEQEIFDHGALWNNAAARDGRDGAHTERAVGDHNPSGNWDGSDDRGPDGEAAWLRKALERLLVAADGFEAGARAQGAWRGDGKAADEIIVTAIQREARAALAAPAQALDVPHALKVRWGICRNCDHTEVNHTMAHDRCMVARYGECPCPGYAAYDGEGEA